MAIHALSLSIIFKFLAIRNFAIAAVYSVNVCIFKNNCSLYFNTESDVLMTVVAHYERTKDASMGLTSNQIAQAIIRVVKREFANQEADSNIFAVLPVRATSSKGKYNDRI